MPPRRKEHYGVNPESFKAVEYKTFEKSEPTKFLHISRCNGAPRGVGPLTKYGW